MSSPEVLAWVPDPSALSPESWAILDAAPQLEVSSPAEAPAPARRISQEELRPALERSRAEALFVVTGPLAPTYLERARALLASEPELDAVHERWARRWPSGQPAPLSERCRPRLAYLLPRNALLRAALTERHPGAPESAEFWTQAALAGVRLGTLPLSAAPTPGPAPDPASLARAWRALAAGHRQAIDAELEEVLVSQEALITDLREYRRLLQAEAAEQERTLRELHGRLAAARAALGL